MGLRDFVDVSPPSSGGAIGDPLATLFLKLSFLETASKPVELSMSVLVIAALGIALVLISILVLRLHPLIGLLLGSLFLLAATPSNTKLENELTGQKRTILKLSERGFVGLRDNVVSGEYMLWAESGLIDEAVPISLRKLSNDQLPRAGGEELSGEFLWYEIQFASGSVAVGDALIPAEAFQIAQQNQWVGLGEKLAAGFAKTFQKLGIPVTMAAIVGICLLESGSAAKLVGAIIALFGSRGTAPALTVSGFLLGVPVFFDNVFYLLLPLAKAVGRKRPETYLAAVMAIIVGATMAHSLVPPTPGPLLVASALNVSIGTMMLAGFIVGSSAAAVGFTYGMLCHRWVKFSPPDDIRQTTAESETPSRRSPPLWLSALPIALPVAVLGGAEVFTFATSQTTNLRIELIARWIEAINDPSLIFIATGVLAIGILRYYSDRKTVSRSVAKGLSDAGTIVLLTCAGGAFGASLQQLQLADAIGQYVPSIAPPVTSAGLDGGETVLPISSAIPAWLPILATVFFLTAIIRAAQGSATVAMITSVAIVAPIMNPEVLQIHPVYVALAIGCGSKPLPWMNDSGFWQVATMTGMTPGQTLKSFSAALTLMGITGFAVTLLGAWLFPMV